MIDTPITEYGFAGIAVGAAMAGLRPIVEFMTFNFAHAGDRPHHQLGGQDASTCRAARCAARSCSAARTAPRPASAPSTARTYASWYAQVPGLIVIAPYTAADAKGLLKAAIRDRTRWSFLENELLYGRSFDVPELDDFTVPIGKARIVREGRT